MKQSAFRKRCSERLIEKEEDKRQKCKDQHRDKGVDIVSNGNKVQAVTEKIEKSRYDTKGNDQHSVGLAGRA